MPKQLCKCGTIHDGPGIFCPTCKPVKPQPTKSREARGLGNQHRKTAKQIVEANRKRNGGIGICEHCGKQETKQNPLTGQHTIPRALGGANSPLVAWCRSCNSSDGARIAAIMRQRRKLG